MIPLFNGGRHAPLVVPPLREALDRKDVREVIVVDDGSADGGRRCYEEARMVVLESGGRLGPAACRNLGAKSCNGSIVLFLDSDVVMSPAVPQAVLQAFAANPGCVAVFGSYDDRPSDPSPVSQYRNLLHHYIHQRGNPEASTFWAGCGAVNRFAFLAAGGFDSKRYPRPSIEDIELGQRLREQGGRILLAKSIQVTHLKRWTLRSMIATDVFQRALPWGRLLLRSPRSAGDLNLSRSERSKAVLAVAFWPAALAVPWFSPAGAVAACLLLAGFVASRDLLCLVRRRRGGLAMILAALLHQLYYTYCAIAFAYCLVESRWHRLRKAGAVLMRGHVG